MKKYLLLLIGILIITTAVAVTVQQNLIAEVLPPPKIYINEFMPDPEGADPGDEWIELYNNHTEEINLTGWTIEDGTGSTYGSGSGDTSLDGFIIPPRNFLVLEHSDLNFGLNNGGDIIILKSGGIEVDRVAYGGYDDGNKPDNAFKPPENESSGRLPDGQDTDIDIDDFHIFENSTKGTPNTQPPIISNKSTSPTCILATDNVTLQATVTGFCIEQVIFSARINNTQINQTGTQIPGTDNYTTTLSSSLFQGNETVEWTVYVTDCFNRTEKDGIETFYVNSRTELTVLPPNPTGLNNWYISEPLFTLTNPDGNISYRWNGNFFTYTGPFGLEGTPNNGNQTGGIHVLKYWSDICSEPEQNKTFYFDFRDPTIEQFQPTGKITNQKPTISAYLEELYQSNSGINIESVSMYLDNSPISPTISQADTLDAIATYIPPANLSIGQHNVTIQAADNSGRNSELTWTFEIIQVIPLTLTINSPINNSNHSEKRILLDIQTNEEVENLKYKDLEDNNPKLRRLCRDCNKYNRTKTFKDGPHNLLIQAITDDDEILATNQVSFFIDSKEPKIYDFAPEDGNVIPGSLFEIEYTELEYLSLE